MEKIKKYLYIAPTLLFIGGFFLYGFFQGFLQSFGLYRIVGESSFTLEYYMETVRSRSFWDSLLFTSKMAVVSSTVSLIISVIIIYIIYLNMERKFVQEERFQKIVESPLLVPYLIASYLILILFMQSGSISKLLVALGVIEGYSSFPILTNDRGGVGIMIAYIWKTTPFIVMMAIPVLKRVKSKWDSLAHIFNVGRTRFFMEVALPLMGPSLLMSFFIVLAYIFTAFEVPYILGVTYPKALAVGAYEIYSRGSLADRPSLMVINMIISFISLGSGVLVYFINKFFVGKNKGAWE
ncbi:ABC transporter permease [Propionigenium maris DSM 9537]|uniref:ABC transporter permease n=1 Tax=Propionigenium maris DSM 9537 TaxID=1123000 RepID=A0A9W6LMP6_9FUSO|nr:ABC transporter permease subunit [Propionigenium maris]GLI55130.1 ABC transporter permease [Propionigenium maris DSM 9537]